MSSREVKRHGDLIFLFAAFYVLRGHSSDYEDILPVEACPLTFKFFLGAAFERPKPAEKSPLIRRGGWLGHSEKASMHFAIQKYSFGGRCKWGWCTYG